MSASEDSAQTSASAPLLYIEKPGECCIRSDTRISRRTGTWPWKSGRSANVYIASISGELGATVSRSDSSACSIRGAWNFRSQAAAIIFGFWKIGLDSAALPGEQPVNT